MSEIDAEKPYIKFVGYLIAAAILLPVGTPAYANDCEDAISKYNSAISDIESGLKQYAQCVGNSSGRDDCDYEFRRLKSYQDDFESAVSSYRSNCE